MLDRRDQTLGVDAAVIGGALIAAPQMDRRGLVIEPFQIEADTDPERRRGSEIAVELHRAVLTDLVEPCPPVSARKTPVFKSRVAGVRQTPPPARLDA